MNYPRSNQCEVVMETRQVRSLGFALFFAAAKGSGWYLILYLLMYPVFVASAINALNTPGPKIDILAILACVGSGVIIIAGIVLVVKLQRDILNRYRDEGIIGSAIRVTFKDSYLQYDGLTRHISVPYKEIRKVQKYLAWYIVTINDKESMIVMPSCSATKYGLGVSRRGR